MMMTPALALACVWIVVANVVALFPSKDHHWRFAYVMIAIGVPILGWVTMQNGPWVGLIVLAAGASVLRWPVIYLTRWIKQQIAR